MNNGLIENVKIQFTETFNTNPILVFSPGRINIIGEHTDYNDGFVFPAAIDKGIIAGIQKASANISIIYAIDKNEKIEISIDDIQPISTKLWGNYILGVIAEIQKRGFTLDNFDLAFSGDIPGGAGMSSSAALENSVAFGLNTLFNLGISKTDLITISQKAEHNYVGVKCGIMDQYASMFGIKSNALLLDCRTVKAQPYEIDFEGYEILLINTNVKHTLSESAYNNRRLVCESVANILNVSALRDVTEYDLTAIRGDISDDDYQTALYVIQENNRVVDASIVIEKGDLKSLGELLYRSHSGLQNQYKVSCDELDFLVEQAKSNQFVLGARMMGAGFGGCTINLIAQEAINDFKLRTAKAYKEKFKKDCSFYSVQLANGTHLI